MLVREVENIFADIIDHAKAADPVHTRKWFDDLSVLQFDEGFLEIGCPEEAMVQFLRDNCRDSFTRAAQQITGHLVSVDFRVSSDRKQKSAAGSGSEEGLKLHPDYTFDNFVVGPSNCFKFQGYSPAFNNIIWNVGKNIWKR